MLAIWHPWLVACASRNICTLPKASRPSWTKPEIWQRALACVRLPHNPNCEIDSVTIMRKRVPAQASSRIGLPILMIKFKLIHAYVCRRLNYWIFWVPKEEEEFDTCANQEISKGRPLCPHFAEVNYYVINAWYFKAVRLVGGHFSCYTASGLFWSYGTTSSRQVMSG